MNHLRRFKSVRAAQTETQIYGWTDRPEAKEAPPTVERSVDAWGTACNEREVPPGYEFSALSQRYEAVNDAPTITMMEHTVLFAGRGRAYSRGHGF